VFLMQHVLIAEDDPDIAALVRHSLEKAGYRAEVVDSGRRALDAIAGRRPDLLILDLMLPEVGGLDVCRIVRSRSETAALPIIMVTARGEETDRIVGLELGADDYVTKPFSPNELVARVGALLRRSGRTAAADSRLRHGPVELDRERHVVTLEGAPVQLTAKEFKLLEYLMLHRGRVLSRDVLLTDVWGYQYTGGTRTVDVHVRRLREKLPVLGDAIVTVKQFGYKLDE
jgi:two-component system, OmpR family, alkaline phosphatase synthesis response regulator PhoP